jgi:hypothetical protein
MSVLRTFEGRLQTCIFHGARHFCATALHSSERDCSLHHEIQLTKPEFTGFLERDKLKVSLEIRLSPKANQ